MNICTVIAKNYLAHARVLSASFARHHPGGTCFVLVIDEVDGFVDAEHEPFTLVRPEQIGLEAWDEMRGAYDVLELSTAVKPWLLRHLIRTADDGTGTAYLDPDIRIESPMVELQAALLEHAVVLTPHVTRGMPRDGRKPSETDILLAGVFNLGFLGLSNADAAHELLDWWSERLLTDCHVAPERGLFVDQRWMDFAPGLVSDLAILRDQSYNVAYWNLPERKLSRASDGSVAVNGRPLRFFHFSGYSPQERETLSRHQTRVVIAEDQVLGELCLDYADALTEQGHEVVRDFAYEHDVLPSGTRLTAIMRSLYRAGVEAGQLPESVFTPAGEAELIAWLNEQDRAEPRLTRFLRAVWARRVDLQRTYPDPGGRDREDYLGWCAIHGRQELAIPTSLLAPHPLETTAPAESTHTVKGPSVRAARPDRELPFGVNVTGYLRSELGIGEVARQLIGALDAVGVPALPVGLTAPGSRQNHTYVDERDGSYPFGINLICVNADGLPAFAQQVGDSFFDGRYNIGLWWWEVSDFPDDYLGAFEYVDEVWVGSRFVADALAVVSPVPVIHVPIALEVPHAAALPPGLLGIPDAFTFLFSYDYNSVLARKNPLGLVEAYTRAFGPDDGAALVLKSINSHLHPAEHRRVQQAVDGRADIVLVADYLDPRDKDRLTASCDCYVSLHRSEGFGLTMAEAMFLGKPVVATGFSGNLEYMTPQNSYLVPHRMTPIGTGAAPYPPSGTWAEPDLDAAAALLRRVREQPAEAGARGARAAADIRARHAPKVVGEALQRRLERVAARVGPTGPVVPQAPAATEAQRRVRELVARDAAPAAPSRFGKPGAAARKLVLRGLRPYSAYQNQVNRALETGLNEVAEREAHEQANTRIDERLTGSFVSAMAELRRQRSRIDTLEGLLEAEHQQRHALTGQVAAELETEQQRRQALSKALDEVRLDHDGRLRRAEQHLAEAQALPYMSVDAFSTFRTPHAGRVLGYAESHQPEEEDAYRRFEDLFRGSEEFIAERLSRYVPLLQSRGPVVDAGCGRGELLDVLRDANIEATGVDLDEGMIARCHAKGHASAAQGDIVDYLHSRADASLGAIFSAQVIEHLAPETLRAFLTAAARKLEPGGLFIAETVNPHSVAALKAFWMDITHRHPLFPEAMLVLCQIAGFGSAYVFHPNGVGDVDADRFTAGEYAVVAER